MSKRQGRIAHKQKAAAVLEDHGGPIFGMLADVLSDLAEENEGLSQFESDMQCAIELGYRIDSLVNLGDPIAEALDGAIASLIALAAIGIWRDLAKRERLRGERLDRLKDRLKSRGPKMAPLARRRLQKRIGRIQSSLKG